LRGEGAAVLPGFAAAVVVWLAAVAAPTEIKRKREKIRFMLNLIALLRTPGTSADWMHHRREEGAFILPRASTGWGKTLRSFPPSQNLKVRD
jgi:hypothetical protein